jgi:hypothetical protein
MPDGSQHQDGGFIPKSRSRDEHYAVSLRSYWCEPGHHPQFTVAWE